MAVSSFLYMPISIKLVFATYLIAGIVSFTLTKYLPLYFSLIVFSSSSFPAFVLKYIVDNIPRFTGSKCGVNITCVFFCAADKINDGEKICRMVLNLH